MVWCLAWTATIASQTHLVVLLNFIVCRRCWCVPLAGERTGEMVVRIPKGQAPEGLEAGMVVGLTNGMQASDAAWKGGRRGY